MKTLVKRLLWILAVALLAVLTWFVWPRLPIITAFAAKGMCSSVFLADKTPERVHAEDLSFFPISLAKCKVNYEEKSVTARLLGLAKRKAVFREGLGAVIVLDTPEEVLLEASYSIPDPGYSQDTILWPKGDVLPEHLTGGVDYSSLNTVLEEALDKPGEEPLKKTLGVEVGETTEDRTFSLEVGRCFGACGLAPVVMIDDDTHQRVKPSKIKELLAPYAAEEGGDE